MIFSGMIRNYEEHNYWSDLDAKIYKYIWILWSIKTDM